MIVGTITKLPIKMEGCLDKEKNHKKKIGFILFVWHQTFMANTWFEPKLIQTLGLIAHLVIFQCLNILLIDFGFVL